MRAFGKWCNIFPHLIQKAKNSDESLNQQEGEHKHLISVFGFKHSKQTAKCWTTESQLTLSLALPAVPTWTSSLLFCATSSQKWTSSASAGNVLSNPYHSWTPQWQLELILAISNYTNTNVHIDLLPFVPICLYFHFLIPVCVLRQSLVPFQFLQEEAPRLAGAITILT